MSYFKIRIATDISNLDLPPEFELDYKDINDKDCIFYLKYIPDEGIWKDKVINFKLYFNSNYPISPPKVYCLTKVFTNLLYINKSFYIQILMKKVMFV